MMRKLLFSIVLLLATAVYSVGAKKSYDDLYKGKTVLSSTGLMTLKLCEGKVYAEIPETLLGEKLLMATVIERTSDAGEGAAGQISDNCVPIILTVKDSVLNICVPREDVLANATGDSSIDAAISHSSIPGVWKQYKVECMAPDGSVVVDMTDFFMSHYTTLHTFPQSAYNSVGGQVKRVHKLVKDKSSFIGVSAVDDIVSVTGDFFYTMDGYVMGMMRISGDFSVRAMVRKMIFRPRNTSSATKIKPYPGLGVKTRRLSVLNSVYGVIESDESVVRLMLEPSDSVKWQSGELVNPKEPVVFHISDLLPEQWKPYAREGVLAWNTAFEKAGFKDALQVVETPADSISQSPYVSRIIYAPTGMQEIEVTPLVDPYSGEIISSTICLHDGIIKKWYKQLLQQTAASDPRVRGNDIPDSLAGSLVKLMVMHSIAECLGIKANPLSSTAYQTDSLKSPSFTRKYGLTASITEEQVFNYIASEEDVRNGAVTIQQAPGPYDEFIVSWLYGPDSMRSVKRVSDLLSDPTYRYSCTSGRIDPMIYDGDLGSDTFASLDYWVENQKKLFANAFDWFGDKSDDMSFISEMLKSSADLYARQIVRLTQFAGGFSSNEAGTEKPLSSEIQRKAVKKVIACLYDMDWFNSIPQGKLPYGTVDFIAEVYRTNIFNTLMNRYDKVKYSAMSSTEDIYSTEDFLKDIEYELFKSKKVSTKLSSIQMVWQDAYLTFILNKSVTDHIAGERLRVLKPLVSSLASRTSGETRLHYKYLLYRINQSNN